MEVQDGEAIAATIIEFWTMGGYAVGFLIGIAIVAVRSEPGVDEGSGMVFPGGFFGVTWYGNLDSAGPGEGGTMCGSEGTRVGNKLVIFDSEVLGITLIGVDRSKLGGDK